jgi:hypothetical protein
VYPECLGAEHRGGRKHEAIGWSARRAAALLRTQHCPIAFNDVVSRSEAVNIIGSSAREWFQGQQAVRAAYGLEQVKIEAGEVDAWESGSRARRSTNPRSFCRMAPACRMRMTSVFVDEGSGWKLVHLHGSTPVPDEVYLMHQSEWWPGAA